ncbi:unnamed protein product [Lepeophtheirus salmonis]|uniref:(salmon louse) hypothetical protein n=1 Tax=Lepeophtheirus salmonis TaxID=72036 RepID=A0A7R8H464_LEPSM|nr:unnamed protein product [Lepeophtheirus salmonis]CAF2842884.1 unnamed protein product [Lepeophtheirus salmonis]
MYSKFVSSFCTIWIKENREHTKELDDLIEYESMGALIKSTSKLMDANVMGKIQIKAIEHSNQAIKGISFLRLYFREVTSDPQAIAGEVPSYYYYNLFNCSDCLDENKCLQCKQ